MGPLKLVGPGTCRLGSGLCLPPASQPLLWRREPGGEGGAGASGWKSEALGSACLMKKEEPSGTLKF